MSNKMNKGMYSSETDMWATPQSFFDTLNAEFNFTLDPCATKENAKCKKFFTEEDDGLSKSWNGESVFMNPPYGKEISKWVKKASEIAGGVRLFVSCHLEQILATFISTFTKSEMSKYDSSKVGSSLGIQKTLLLSPQW